MDSGNKDNRQKGLAIKSLKYNVLKNAALAFVFSKGFKQWTRICDKKCSHSHLCFFCHEHLVVWIVFYIKQLLNVNEITLFEALTT